uniref:uncharacterized protein KIAA0513-like n=1 Tax=Myxine glutinosa TaxID=7769 RepID=UPI00358F0D9E
MTSNRREDIKRSHDRQGDVKEGEKVNAQKVEKEQPKGRPRTMESGKNGDIEVAGFVGRKISGSESEATESADSDDPDEGGKVDEEEKEDKEGIVMAAEGLLGLCKSLGPGIDCSEQSENEHGGSEEERDFLRVFVTGIFEGSMTEEDAASFAEICEGKHGEGRAWFAHFTTAQAPADGSMTSGAFHHFVDACTVVLNGCEQHADYVPAVCLLPLCFTCYRPVPDNQGGLDAYLRTGRAWLAGSGGRLKSLFGSFGSSQSSQEQQMEKEAAATVDVEGGTNLEDENKDFLYNHLQDLPVWRTSRFWSAAFFTVTHHSPLTEPSSPSQEDGGITSSLRLLTKRMVLLGVGRKHCTELIRKHAAMGHLQPDQLDELIRSVDEATSP